ncbi:hypothetical protein M1146_03730 [Patescibacteria group bacterium]|nr:hypothetical protein [Patescibacteria group bacterium]
MSPFFVMFARTPNNLVAHLEDNGAPLEDVDLNPIPEAMRNEISDRVRQRQEIVTKKMKRRWDTSNTIVCSPFLPLTHFSPPSLSLIPLPHAFSPSFSLSLSLLPFPSLLFSLHAYFHFFKVFAVGNRVLYSDLKRRKTSKKLLPKLNTPIYVIPALVTEVHRSGNITALNLITKQPQKVLATEAKYEKQKGFYECGQKTS